MLIDSIAKMKLILSNKSNIGFVPTMGALHDGHLSLIKTARKHHELVVVSIFVNPSQFAPDEDYDVYPRNLDEDYVLATSAGADYVFSPSVFEIYGHGHFTHVIVDDALTNKLCGASRPTHFKGVTTVVALLINIIKPQKIYLGEKDAQQVILLKRMIKDLHMGLEVVTCPTVRALDGLALSSRNTYLSDKERYEATYIYQALMEVEKKYALGIRDVSSLMNTLTQVLHNLSLGKIDYIEILGYDDLEYIETIQKKTLVAIAVFFGKTRLIDNIVLEGGA
ncbi:pantoate--beta-alanine ligase [Petrocella sp. FN5]|uniref:pantoate--beta-alanine ligase n=1 Tax=Petrocella sp. FN5 TaxID=3032002 RepID=UPI0023DA9FBF|nr:pantoate--beta-alanine ligase [Petrocella sp. FN5]MDF1618509.1 pantoate--beta-alanine ligase [Petrocella sp. FN5]